MKILHVTNWQVPGYGYEEILLGRAQRELGHSVWIIASNYLYPKGYEALGARLPRRKVAASREIRNEVQIMRLDSFEISSRVWIRGLWRAVAGIAPDVVHVHNFLTFHPLRLAVYRRLGLDFCLVVDDHTNWSVVRTDPMARLFYSMVRKIYGPLMGGRIDAFSAKSLNTKHFLMEQCGVRDAIDVIPLGVDAKRLIRSDSSRARGRQLLGCGVDDLVVLYTGKIVEEKKLDLLLRAAVEVLRHHPYLRVVAVGDADDRYLGDLRQIARTIGLEHGRWICLPALPHDDLAPIYAAADIAVWPGSESIGTFEAMAASVPVIVPSQTASATLIGDGGLTFDPNDPGSLSRALEILADPIIRARVSAKARMVAESRSWERLAAENIRMYERGMMRRAPG